MSGVVVIGAGLVGLATAWSLLQRAPRTRLVVLDREDRVCAHQSGRNSGVIHSGVYYRPGSLKARLCAEGREALLRFCADHGVPHAVCGKVIVAATPAQAQRLQSIRETGLANGVPCDLLDPSGLRRLEPAAAGVAALHVPGAGVVDFQAMGQALRGLIERNGAQVVLGAQVRAVERTSEGVRVVTTAGEFPARAAVNCAGLWSDRVALLAGARPPVRIVPFRGEFFRLTPRARDLCRSLIYPVPDPAYPFLGVHLTRTIHGEVICGPNAVLAWARDGYTAWRVSLSDAAATLVYPGFRRLVRAHWRRGMREMLRAWSRARFAHAVRRLVPDVRSEDLLPGPAGVRAQAVGADGRLVDDFLIEVDRGVVHVLNAPSPAATASLAIGRRVADLAASAAGLD